MTGRIKFVSKYRYNSIEFRLHETKQILHTRIGKIIVYKIAYHIVWTYYRLRLTWGIKIVI